MQPLLFDTSIYIRALRRGDDAALNLRRIAGGAPVWLSSVVLEELFVKRQLTLGLLDVNFRKRNDAYLTHG